MRFRPFAAAMLALVLSVLSACGQQPSDSGGQMSYKDMKSMVVDILGSEEAIQAIEKAQASRGTGLKALSLMDQEQLRVTVKNVLTSPEYSKELERIMTDPKFAGEFAKAVNKQNKEIHKELIKDPSYRKELISVLKEPEMQAMFLEATKTSEYRAQMMNAVQEAIQNPLFKLEIMKMLQSVVKEEMDPKRKQDQKQQQGQQGQEGGDQEGQEQQGGENQS
ncbi:MAG TPA: spore germination lipoprotein GerD [Paenibacillaceae bacterium]